MPYLLRVPAAAEGNAPLPVILFLHGAGESGGPPAWRLLPGFDAAQGTWVAGASAPTRSTVIGLALDASPLARGFVVLAPCTRRGWASGEVHADVLALLDEVLAGAHGARCSNASRVILTGLSMGGNGAFELGAAARARFVGVSPVCGWGDASALAPLLRDVPLWVAHGDNDAVIPAEASREMVTALRAAGNTRVEYRTFENSPAPAGAEYMGMEGHDSWTATYGDTEWWAWARALTVEGAAPVIGK